MPPRKQHKNLTTTLKTTLKNLWCRNNFDSEIARKLNRWQVHIKLIVYIQSRKTEIEFLVKRTLIMFFFFTSKIMLMT